MEARMHAMLLDATTSLGPDAQPLRSSRVERPDPGPGEVRVAVAVCGVCHTELDEIEGRTPPPRFPVIPGHQVIGRIDAVGDGVTDLARGDRVGVAWIHSACGECQFCRSGRENLCPDFVATGRDVHGGYAEAMTVPASFAHRIPDGLDDAPAAPLLCAGAIGQRSLSLTGIENGQRLGLTGFGASAHLVIQLVRATLPDSEVFVFARSESSRAFARELGAAWTGATEDRPPELLHAIIDTTPAWTPVVAALAALEPAGRLVINAIGKQDDDIDRLTTIDYTEHLWMEKSLRTVANVTREDVRAFLGAAAEHGIRTEFSEYPLDQANRALVDLAHGGGRGAKVLRV